MTTGKRSAAVMVGVVLVAGVSFACAEGDYTDAPEYKVVNYDHQRICLDENGYRVPDHHCPHEGANDGGAGPFYRTWYTGKGQAAPPVGSRANVSTGSGTRPTTGTVGVAPEAGGFGTHIATVGG